MSLSKRTQEWVDAENARVDVLTAHNPPREDIVCPFCEKGEFDLIGLKGHLQRGYCSIFEKIQEAQSSFSRAVEFAESQHEKRKATA